VAGLVLRVRLFLSSFVPLFIILSIRFEDWALQAVFATLALVGLITLVAMFRNARRIGAEPHSIEAVADRGAEVAGYLATYLLPFVTAPEPSPRDLIAYGLFLAVVGVVYVRSDMLQINPLIYLGGYRVWSIRTEDGWIGYLVARHQPRRGDTLLASRLANTLAVERQDEHPVAARPRSNPG
jgi:hypothetical protein